MPMFTRAGVGVLAMMFLSACGGSSDESSPPAMMGPGPSTTTGGVFSAKIDGVAWTATTVSTLRDAGSLSATGAAFLGGGTTTSAALGFTLVGTGAVTYPVNASSGAANVNLQIIGGSAPGGWANFVSGSSGSIVVTSVTATGMSGTFSFTLGPVAGTGALGNKTVTEGVFNVTF